MKLSFGDRSLWEARFPGKPKVGPPLHADAVAHRDCEETYHWKIWSPDQLRAYERYWDEVVGLLARFLPEDVRRRGKDVHGVNLGTGTGCYQKAWERLGYRMYGLEREDSLIPYLHEYGCAGERANFLRMPQIHDAQWDFAVLDRAMLGQEGVYRRVYLEGNGRLDRHDREYGPYSIPPYVEEVMRVLKPDGVLLTVLLPFWTDDLVEELASYGRLTMWPVAPEKPHPFLVASVERGHPPTEVMSRRDFHDRALAADAATPAALAEGLTNDPNCGFVRSGDDTVRFLHLPSNHLVEYQRSATGWEVTEDRYWTDVAWRFEQRAPDPLPLRPKRGIPRPHAQLIRQTKRARRGRPHVMVLGDAMHASKNGKVGFAGKLYATLGSAFNFVHVPHSGGRSQDVLNNIEEWLSVETDFVVLMAGREDAWVSVTRSIAPKRIRNHARNIEDIVRSIKAKGSGVVWVPAVRVDPAHAVRRMPDGTISHRLCNDALREFNAAVLQLIGDEVDEIADLNDALDRAGGVEGFLAPDGVTLAAPGAAVAIDAIGAALGRASRRHG